MLSLYSKLTSIDSVFTRFGDQCIVVRKDFLNRLNGFNDWPLFEDVDLLRRARRLTRIYSLPARVTTSSRRFIKEGFIRQQLLNGLRIFQFLSGVPPYKIAGKYNTKKNEVNSPGKGAS
jgi:predicted glycosyltransferase involved in capsule biosynthesis